MGVSWVRWSAIAGQRAAAVNAISVRSRPTPAAPPDRPSRVSAADATLHSSVTGWPSAVVRLSVANLGSWVVTVAVWAAMSSGSGGSTISSPRPASSIA